MTEPQVWTGPFVWILLGVGALIGTALALRFYALRPSITRTFRSEPRAPLATDEVERIFAWARLGVRLYIGTWVACAAVGLAVGTRMLPPGVLAAMAAVGVGVLFWHQFSGKCPRCAFRLGLEPRGFGVPLSCPRCRVVLNPRSALAPIARALGVANEGGSQRPVD
jgi:hypothetical protein